MKEISEKILFLAQQELLLKMPFFNRVLLRTAFQPAEVSFAFDGHILFYNPLFIIYCYKSNPKEPERLIMHSLLHFVFSPPFVKGDIHTLRWDLSCDIAVEDALIQMHVTEPDDKKMAMLALLKHDISAGLTAEKIYKWFKDNAISDEELQ